MAVSEDKLNLLRSLLKENPELGMKEANVTIREQFGTGVAPPQYSKIKKELEANGSEAKVETEVKEKPKKVKVAKEVKVKEEPAEVVKEDSPELESFFDGKAAEEVKATEEAKVAEVKDPEPLIADEKVEEEVVAEAEPEEEVPPPPSYPIKLEVVIENADSVHLSGSFNKWNIEQFPLTKGEDSKWVFDSELPEGEHFYKFVINKKLWHIDLDQEHFVDPTGISHKLTVTAS